MNNKIDALLTQLESVTNIPLNESDDFGVSKTFEVLQKALFGSYAASRAVVDDDMYDLIKKCRRITITPEYRVVTYQNIHTDFAYKLDANKIMGYVFSKINNSSSNNSDFDSTKTVHEAISLSFKELTGLMPKKEMSVDEFRHHYTRYVYGTFVRTQIIPNVSKLSALALNTPYKINYVSNQGIYKHIKSISAYSRDTVDDFTRIEKNNPDLSVKITSYKKAIMDAISSLVQIYKIILRALDTYYHEYRRVFKEIIRINAGINAQNESICCIASLINDSKKNNLLQESTDNYMGIDITLPDLDKKINTMLLTHSKRRKENLESLNNNMHFIYNFNTEWIKKTEYVPLDSYTCCQTVVKPLKHINIDKLFNLLPYIDKDYDGKSEEFIMKHMLFQLECENLELVHDNTIMGKLEKYITGEKYFPVFDGKENIAVNIETISNNCMRAFDIMKKIDKFLNNKSTYLKQLSNKKNLLIYYMIFECIFSNLNYVISESQLLCKTFADNAKV